MPTYDERLVWGSGDGHGLRTNQIGEFTFTSLNCWENWVCLLEDGFSKFSTVPSMLDYI